MKKTESLTGLVVLTSSIIGALILGLIPVWLSRPTHAQSTQGQPSLKVYNTVVGLVQANPNMVDNVVICLGQQTTTDGLGGIFFYNPSDATATNTFTVFAPTTGVGRWKNFPLSVNLVSGGGTNSTVIGNIFANGATFTNAPTLLSALAVAGGGTAGTNSATALVGLGISSYVTNTVPLSAGGTGGTNTATALTGLGIGQWASNTTVASLKLALGIQQGTQGNTNSFSNTNTFNQGFSGIPSVTVSSTATNIAPAVLSITTSNFVWSIAATNMTVQWIAVGAP